MNLTCNLTSDMGLHRTNNEDMVLLNGEFYRDAAHQDVFCLADNARMAALVADGMGGYEGGEFASELALQSFQEMLEALPDDLDSETLQEMVRSWATDAHYLIVQKGIDMPQFSNMGTTLVGLLFYHRTMLWVNIGDSRIYRFRDGVLRQLSKDHSMRELYNDPSQPSNLIYNALGGGDKAFADVEDITARVMEGDRYIICSDGLTDMVDDDTIERILTEGGHTAQLVEAAKAAGGKDNVSVLEVEVTAQPNCKL